MRGGGAGPHRRGFIFEQYHHAQFLGSKYPNPGALSQKPSHYRIRDLTYILHPKPLRPEGLFSPRSPRAPDFPFYAPKDLHLSQPRNWPKVEFGPYFLLGLYFQGLGFGAFGLRFVRFTLLPGFVILRFFCDLGHF